MLIYNKFTDSTGYWKLAAGFVNINSITVLNCIFSERTDWILETSKLCPAKRIVTERQVLMTKKEQPRSVAKSVRDQSRKAIVWANSKFLRQLLLFALVFALTLFLAPAVIIQAGTITWPTAASVVNDSGRWPELAEITCGSYIVIERASGEVLLAKEPDKQLFPASTTKILTALLALEELNPDKLLTVSEQAVKLTAGSSKVGYLAGEQVYARDLLAGLMLASGNDAANVIAEAISGSEAAFATAMNARARAAGAANSNFINPSGIHVAEHVTTARDLALIAAEAMKNKDFCNLVSLESASMPATNKHPLNGWAIVANTNRLLLYGDSYLAAPELKAITGIKTGSTNAAGDNLIAAASSIDGTELIGVLLGVPLRNVTSNKFVFMRTLLSEAARKAAADKPTPVPTSAPTTTAATSVSTSTPTTTAATSVSTSAPTTTAATSVSTSAPTITTASNSTPVPTGGTTVGIASIDPVSVLVGLLIGLVIGIILVLILNKATRRNKRRRSSNGRGRLA